MVKADLIAMLQEQGGFSRRASAEAVEVVLGVLKEAMQKGEMVRIVNFGTFKVREKQERLGRHPRTGRALIITPRKVITFKSSRLLRDWVNAEEAP
jgi:integration host factor subunit alpha